VARRVVALESVVGAQLLRKAPTGSAASPAERARLPFHALIMLGAVWMPSCSPSTVPHPVAEAPLTTGTIDPSTVAQEITPLPPRSSLHERWLGEDLRARGEMAQLAKPSLLRLGSPEGPIANRAAPDLEALLEVRVLEHDDRGALLAVLGEQIVVLAWAPRDALALLPRAPVTLYTAPGRLPSSVTGEEEGSAFRGCRVSPGVRPDSVVRTGGWVKYVVRAPWLICEGFLPEHATDIVYTAVTERMEPAAAFCYLRGGTVLRGAGSGPEVAHSERAANDWSLCLDHGPAGKGLRDVSIHGSHVAIRGVVPDAAVKARPPPRSFSGTPDIWRTWPWGDRRPAFSLPKGTTLYDAPDGPAVARAVYPVDIPAPTADVAVNGRREVLVNGGYSLGFVRMYVDESVWNARVAYAARPRKVP
jgi:hypothetical protein